MKEYFSHDYDAGSRLAQIEVDFGLAGVGLYWKFVELLHRRGGTVPESELRAVAYDLHAEPELLSGILHCGDYFTVENGVVSSPRVLRNLEKRRELSEIRKNAAFARWKEEKPAVPAPEKPALPALPLLSAQAEAAGRWEEDGDEDEDETETEEPRCESSVLNTWIPNALEKMENEAAHEEHFEDNPIWAVKSEAENIVSEIKKRTFVQTECGKVNQREYADKLKWYFYRRQNLEVLKDLIDDVNKKVHEGAIANRDNYLISAVYGAAKSRGA